MKKPTKRRATILPRKMSSNELCKSLVAIAGFTEDEPTRLKIYEAVRRLQLLEAAAVEAKLIRSSS